MSNVQAAIGVAQLERIDQILAKKRQIGRWYQQRLRGHPQAAASDPSERNTQRTSTGYLAVVLDDAVPFDAAEVMARLRRQGS